MITTIYLFKLFPEKTRRKYNKMFNFYCFTRVGELEFNYGIIYDERI